MDFVRKHWEKLLLVVVLFSVIGAAGWLMMRVGDLNNELMQGRRAPRQKGKPAEPVDATPYNQAIANLQQPFQWAPGQRDPFLPPKIETPTEIVTNEAPRLPTSRLALLRVDRVPFKMNVRAYVGEGRNFQIDFKFRPRTFFVEKVGDPIRDRFEDTGYRIIKFEKKIEEQFNPRIGAKMQVDVSELTIQREGEKPIVLVVNREAEEEEPVATARCETASGSASDFRVRRGQQFNCGGKAYKVVDITSNGMIITDIQTEEKRTLPISRE
jgi:hypothetical protein